jgi:hypothetical protein
MIAIANSTENNTYSIDLLRHTASGERYVTVSEALWNADGDCTGYAITQMAGPLTEAEIDQLRADPTAWDADPEFDLAAISATIGAQGSGSEWSFAEELQGA